MNHLFEYCLRLADTPLILGQRLGEWCGHGPILEEDIALTNISLDLFGQASGLLTYAASVEGKGRTEDDLAFLRDVRDFRNALIVEQPNSDYGQTILRQFLVSAYLYFLYESLSSSKDSMISGIAAKSLKEVAYHLRHSTEWVLRMGDGTEESHQRMLKATDELWMYTGDLFDADEVEHALVKNGIAVDLNTIHSKWLEKVRDVYNRATLPLPSNVFMIKGSRQGRHSEHLGHILAEMQVLPRMYPDAKW